MGISDSLLEGGYKGINIWGLNEIGYGFAKILQARRDIPFAVIGEFWDKLGFENSNQIIEHGYDLYVEGNRAIPLTEMGKWRFDFPEECFSDLELRIERVFEGKSFFFKRMLSENEGRHWLYEHLVSGSSFMAARLGFTEENILSEYLDQKAYSKKWLQWLYTTSGFFSNNLIDLDDVERFAEKEKEAVMDTDLHLYMDRGAVGVINRLASACSEICNVDILLHEDARKDDEVSWIEGLKGKRVLVVSPFEQTVKIQYQKRNDVYSGNKRLPDFELLTYKMLETQNGVKCGFQNFFEAYNYVREQIQQINFDIALVSGGAYGYLLAHDIKKMGKASIELCGNLMPLFGIKIKRHAVSPQMTAFWNKHWIFPVEEPVKNAYKIENGCYWG